MKNKLLARLAAVATITGAGCADANDTYQEPRLRSLEQDPGFPNESGPRNQPDDVPSAGMLHYILGTEITGSSPAAGRYPLTKNLKIAGFTGPAPTTRFDYMALR